LDPSTRLATPEEARREIAELILGAPPSEITVGAISLEPHQVSALSRIVSALQEFGGALLCDEVGMGKTFVATAVAKGFNRPLIVAPAALSPMWRTALELSGVNADLTTFEKLSRAGSDRSRSSGRRPKGARLRNMPEFDLLIVDEAHHARNRLTRRYARLQSLARNAKVLLLTATPIHNNRDEMIAVLSLFLGSRAANLTSAELARCVVRRDHSRLGSTKLIPRILPAIALELGADDRHIVRSLTNLPTALPPRDAGTADSIVGRGLVHQWASSEAALDAAVRRRIARAIALIAALEAGTYPTRQELRSWTFADGALQLGFPELLAETLPESTSMLDCIKRHHRALDAFRTGWSSTHFLDAARTRLILAVRNAHPDAKIVAFAQYAETVAMLFRELARDGRVCMLTATGARVAGGKLSRREALERFAPDAARARQPAESERIDLLLATDLLSEGVNLQDAEIVVHLDLPWTSARMEQRVGRLARMGSRHSTVQTYWIRPPASAAALLETERIIQRKWKTARVSVGSSHKPFGEQSDRGENLRAESVAELTESLRSLLESWRASARHSAGSHLRSSLNADSHTSSNETTDRILLAAVQSEVSGFIAAISVDGRSELLAKTRGIISTDLAAQITGCRHSVGRNVASTLPEYDAAMAEINSWSETISASELAGLVDSATVRRKRLVNRIDSAIEGVAPHLRAHRLPVAARARRLVTGPHSAAVEAELDSFSVSPLSGDEWLEAIASLDSRVGESANSADGGCQAPGSSNALHGSADASTMRKVHALILLKKAP
jgi:superfamily II DNA or RNA helicase